MQNAAVGTTEKKKIPKINGCPRSQNAECKMQNYSSNGVLATAHIEALGQSFGMRLGRVCPRDVEGSRSARGSHGQWSRNIHGIAVALDGCAETGGTHPIFFHPSEPVGVLFNGKNLPGVLFNASVAFPYTAGFFGILQVGPKVGSTLASEGFLQDFELFSVPAGDAHGNLDLTVYIFDRPADTSGESSTKLQWRQFFERQCDPVYP